MLPRLRLIVGIGYEMARNNDNESKYKYFTSQAEVNYVWRLARNFYLGPMLNVDYINARDMENPNCGKDKATSLLTSVSVLPFSSITATSSPMPREVFTLDSTNVSVRVSLPTNVHFRSRSSIYLITILFGNQPL